MTAHSSPDPRIDLARAALIKTLMSDAPRKNIYDFALGALQNPEQRRAELSLMFALDINGAGDEVEAAVTREWSAVISDPGFTDEITGLISRTSMQAALACGRVLIDDERMDRILSGDESAGPFDDDEFGLYVGQWSSKAKPAEAGLDLPGHALVDMFHLSVTLLPAAELERQLRSAQNTTQEILAAARGEI